MTSTSAVTPAPLPVDPHLGRRRVRRGSVRTGKYVALVFFAVLVLTPVYVLLVTSFKGLAEIDPSRAWNLPDLWSTEAWRQAWDQLSPNMRNSPCGSPKV